jgi:type VI secretion system protein ImpA
MTQPLLDFAALLAPIPGDEPAGGTVPHALRQKLRAARKETERHPEDPSQPDIPRKVDWAGLVRTCQETLTTSSKDLEVALQLLEALAKIKGFAGVRDGLHLLHGLLAECWDRLHPIPDEGEGMEVRAERFNWINEADRGALFPATIRNLPLVKIDNQTYNYQDRQAAAEGRGPVDASEFERSVPASPTQAAEVAQSLEELGRLEAIMQEHFGPDAPSLMGLRQALEECNSFIQLVQARQSPSQGGAEEETAGESDATGNGPVGRVPGLASGPLRSREDAYRQIAQVANFLERLEPHSPIPDLLRKAIELGRMPFRQLIHAMVRDTTMLAEIRREFGIKEIAEAAGQPSPGEPSA